MFEQKIKSIIPNSKKIVRKLFYRLNSCLISFKKKINFNLFHIFFKINQENINTYILKLHK